MKFTIEYTDEVLAPTGGLPLVGHLLDKSSLKKRMNSSRLHGNPNPSIDNADVVCSYIGLLCQGKNDFDHIETARADEFFAYAMRLSKVPSSPTLRQRLDEAAGLAFWEEILCQESARLLKKVGAPLTATKLKSGSYLTLDVDVSPFDNSKTKKQGVSRTYKGFDGYAPIFAYLADEGYWLNVHLREGKDHSQKGTVDFLKETIRLAQLVSSEKLLVRMDSGNDSADNIRLFETEGTRADYIIKRNLRKEKLDAWLAIAKQHGTATSPRDGKLVYTGSIERSPKGFQHSVRLVFQVIERTITKNGQILLVPDIEVNTYWTSLPDDEAEIIRLYREHGTSEQFHSEIKTDLDLERLPSGKFATNNLVLHLALMAYNILRILGQMTVTLPDGLVPLKKKAQRRRIRTVIQNLITIAVHMVKHARHVRLRFNRKDRWLPVFEHLNFILAPS